MGYLLSDGVIDKPVRKQYAALASGFLSQSDRNSSILHRVLIPAARGMHLVMRVASIHCLTGTTRLPRGCGDFHPKGLAEGNAKVGGDRSDIFAGVRSWRF
jgi:hypothetical protein